MAVNLLISFAFHGKTDIRAIRRLMPCGRILIDSGAFTAWSTGKPINLTQYAEFLVENAGVWNHAVTLDVIGDPVATAKNTLILHGKGIPVMPVFTIGGTLAEFDAMVRDVGYVCVGGTVGMMKEHQTRRLAMLQRRALDLGGGIHALGVGAIPALRRIRPYSADASNVSIAFKFGTIIYWNGRGLCHLAVNDQRRFDRAVPHLAQHGIDVNRLFRRNANIMPNATGRLDLMRGMSYAYAVADEALKRSAPVPSPNSVDDIPGVHLYNSAIPNLTLPIAQTDAEIHSGTAPPIWSRYKATHVCAKQKAALP